MPLNPPPRDSDRTPSRGFLAALGLVLLGTGAAALREVVGLPMAGFQGALLAAGIGWALAVRMALRGGGDTGVVLALAVVLRLVAGFGAPGLSDDPYRYVWEGEVLTHGLSPYAFAPDDERLEFLRIERPELARVVGHGEIPAVYPPLAQYLNAVISLVVDQVGLELDGRGDRVALAPLRLVYGCLDLLLLLPLARLLRRRELPTSLIVTWAASPLVVLSFAGTGHLDILALLMLVLALEAGERGRPLRAGIRLAAGIASKYLPLLAVPVLLRATERQQRTRFLVALVLGTLLFGLPVLFLEGGGARLVGGLGTYGRSWEGGSLVFRWIDLAVREAGLPGDPRLVARLSIAGLFVGWSCFVLLRRWDPVRATGALIGAWVVLTPTLHPWYLTWIVPFVALRPRASWMVLLILAPLLWWPVEGWQEHGSWVEPAFVWPMLALPFFTLRILEALRRRP